MPDQGAQEIFDALYEEKRRSGYKNVPKLLKESINRNVRPTLACIFPDSSVAKSDFYEGLGKSVKDYALTEICVPFSSADLSTTVKELDNKGYDAIAIIRGGGSYIEVLDETSLSKVVVQMKTPTIYGCGHNDNNLYIRKLVDLDRPIPYALGSMLNDISNNA